MRKRALVLRSSAARGKDVSGSRRRGQSLSQPLLDLWLWPVVGVHKKIQKHVNDAPFRLSLSSLPVSSTLKLRVFLKMIFLGLLTHIRSFLTGCAQLVLNTCKI